MHRHSQGAMIDVMKGVAAFRVDPDAAVPILLQALGAEPTLAAVYKDLGIAFWSASQVCAGDRVAIPRTAVCSGWRAGDDIKASIKVASEEGWVCVCVCVGVGVGVLCVCVNLSPVLFSCVVHVSSA